MPNPALVEELLASSKDIDPMERFKTVHFWLLVIGAALGFVGQAVLLPGTRLSVILTGLGGSFGTIGGIMASMWKPARDRALIAASAQAGTDPRPPGATGILPPAAPLLALLLFVTVLPGCTLAQAVTGSYKGLAVAEATVLVTMEKFPTASRNHRLAIVAKAASEDQGKAELAAWDVVESRISRAIIGTDATVKLCRDAIAEISKGIRDKSQLAGWIATGIRLGIDIKDLLAASGVPLEGI